MHQLLVIIVLIMWVILNNLQTTFIYGTSVMLHPFCPPFSLSFLLASFPPSLTQISFPPLIVYYMLIVVPAVGLLDEPKRQGP